MDFASWDSEAKELDDNIRHLVAISTLASANRPQSIAQVAQRRLQRLDQEVKHQTHFIQQAREALLKMSSIMGTPRSINALTSLMTVVSDNKHLKHVIAQLDQKPTLRGVHNYNYLEMKERGQQLFNGIYGKYAERVESKLNALCPDLAEVILVDSYGRLLGETKYLEAMDTELCAIGSLVPLGVPDQLKSHCIGASRLGATEDMVQAALRLAKLVCSKRL